MKKLLLIMLLGLTTSLAAENPPESYQKFQYEVKNMELPENKVNSFDKRDWIGIGIGATAFAVTECFLLTGNRKAYHKSIFIGMAVHLTYQIIAMSTEDVYKHR